MSEHKFGSKFSTIWPLAAEIWQFGTHEKNYPGMQGMSK